MNQAERPQTLVSVRYIKISVLLALGLAHVLATLFFVVPGYLSVDEAVYHIATKSFWESGTFEIWNAYQELPSPEMHHLFFPPYKGRLVSQYPYLFSVIAAPMYRIAGFYGLFLINALAFIGVVFLCYGIAKRVLTDDNLALNACLILAICTFSWEYSQAAWPHMTSVLVILAAFYCAIRSYYGETKTQTLWWALGAGLIAGFGPSIRMEGALVFPVLVSLFLFTRPWRPQEVCAVALGLTPGLVAFALANEAKFGSLVPFTYGGSSNVSPFVVVGVILAMAAAWVLTRSRFTKFLETHRGKLFWGGIAALIAALVFPHGRSFLLELVRNFWVSIVDIRWLDPSLILPAMTRSSGGGVIYLGAQKKALMQSLPFLAILAIPVIRVLKVTDDYPRLLILLLMPVTSIAYYAYAFHHSGAHAGGLCLNYRYALPLLPFLAILSAYSMEQMKMRWGKSLTVPTAIVLCFGAALVYFLLVKELPASLNDLEFPLLDVPLLLAGALLLMVVLGETVKGKELRALRPAVWGMLTVTLAWSVLVAFFYDYPAHRSQRERNYRKGEEVRQVVAPGSVFFTSPVVDPFIRVIENHRVAIAFPDRDRFRDFPKLVDFHLKAGRRVYGAFYNGTWANLKSGPLAKYTVTPRMATSPGFTIGEISLPRQSSQPKAEDHAKSSVSAFRK